MTGTDSSPSFRKRIIQSPFVTRAISIARFISCSIIRNSAPITRAERNFNITTNGEHLERIREQRSEYVRSIGRLHCHENMYPLISNPATRRILHPNSASSADLQRVSGAIRHLEHPLCCQPGHCRPPSTTTRRHTIYLPKEPTASPNTYNPPSQPKPLSTSHKPLPGTPSEWKLPGEVHRRQAGHFYR